MFPKVYVSNDDGHFVFAREGTAGDLAAGRVGAVGDYLAMRDGHGRAQWWTKSTFESAYTEQTTPATDEQLEQLEQLAPHIAAGNRAGEQLTAAAADPTQFPIVSDTAVVPRSNVLEALDSLDELQSAVRELLASAGVQLEQLAARVAKLEAAPYEPGLGPAVDALAGDLEEVRARLAGLEKAPSSPKELEFSREYSKLRSEMDAAAAESSEPYSPAADGSHFDRTTGLLSGPMGGDAA